uniref:Putative ribonuclease H-like domain-containing protein n=1 Tax=Tanacetum cinerariifolium TaxID=118510 RepID=A0A6L2LLG5_TANCI|nr:putative ribonuclease H-like domain-containing protein [Tanacetum cinerariifolium]
MSYLSDFEELNGGYVAFGGNPKGGKISGKGKIRTGKLDFDDVYFVKELKFNLFSVSHMCDKKNIVLFTDTECIVLSPEFKLPDENQVLLSVPKENNMYNVDLKNIVPYGDLTCLFAKATLDESNLWPSNIEPLVRPSLSVLSANHYKEDGPVDYPIDEGDDGDDDDGDSSGDDADDEDEDEEDKEEKEHLAPTDSAVVIPTDELVSPPEGTEPVIPPPFTDTATTEARITVQLQASISFPPKANVKRLLAMPTPSPSPLASLSPPSTGERLARCTAPTALPSPPLPPPLHMPPPVDRRDDILETEMPSRKRLCLSTLGSSTLNSEARQRGIEEVGYGIRDTWVDLVEAVSEIAPMTVREAWAHSIGLSQAVHSELQTYQEQMQQTEIAELQKTDRRRQAQMAETLRVMEEMRREMGDMQAELLALCEQPRRAGQLGGDARFPNHQDAPRDADSHI